MPTREQRAREEERELHEHATELTADIMATMADEIEAMRRNLPARHKLYRAAQTAKWRKEHRERVLEYKRRYEKSHREQKNAYIRRKNRTDPEFHAKLMAKHRRWRLNRSEEAKQRERDYQRRYYAEHREEILAKKRAKAAEKRKGKTGE